MKTMKKWKSFLLIAIILCLLPCTVVNADVTTFSSHNLEVTTPDGVICLTPDTPSYDPLWQEACITDVSDEKDDLDNMGGIAIFYDTASQTTVRLLCKTSTQSKNLFNFNLLTEEEKESFYSTLTEVNDETTTATIEEYPQSEVPFFRYLIQMEDTTSQQELIYGTIVNGSMFYFDIYSQQIKEPLDESLIQALVTGTHFTKQYTKEEYDELTRESIIRLVLYLVLAIVVIVVLVVFSKKRNKAKEAQKKQKAQAVYQYYSKKKEREAQGIKQELLYENHTTYTQDIIRQFCSFTTYTKKLYVWVILSVLYLLLLASTFLLTGLSLQFLIVTVAMIIILCLQHFRVDKLCDSLWKPYQSSPTKVADFHFYEDNFTITGIQYYTEYPYLQITEVVEHKDYIYLYLGTEKAVYLAKDGFTSDSKEFVTFLRNYLKSTDTNKGNA